MSFLIIIHRPDDFLFQPRRRLDGLWRSGKTRIIADFDAVVLSQVLPVPGTGGNLASVDHGFVWLNIRHDMKRIDFACVHHAGRSQMAAAWFNRGLHRYQSRRWSEAADDFTRALELAPDHPDIPPLLQQARARARQ